MLDRNIPFYNTLMRCDTYDESAVRKALAGLPDAVFLRGYQPGDEDGWAALHLETGDFDDFEEARDYFFNTYTADEDWLGERSVFAVERASGRIVGACIAWRDPAKKSVRETSPGATVASLHWLVVAEDFQRRGIGAALCASVLRIYHENGEFPVYLHTQPWSYAAILLYDTLGFRLQKTDAFGSYENQYDDAVKTLKTVLSADDMARLCEKSED